jgi:serine/threonine protein kinase
LRETGSDPYSHFFAVAPTSVLARADLSDTCLTDQVTLDFIARRLDEPVDASVRVHIDQCASCRRLVAESARGVSAAHATHPPSPPPAQARFGRYILDGILGEGAMGVVYRAHDPELDRYVALKLLLPELHEDVAGGDGALRLQREARAMARLSHPNVVSVFDIGSVGRQWFVAMELVEGRTLTRWLAEEQRSVDQILNVFEQAGRGLAAAHAVGLVHRDFKPDNVLVGTDGRPRVTDFGLARRAGVATASTGVLAVDLLGSISQSGTIAGTPAYMAPEQFHGQPVSPQTDQFSFCVALWEALFGEPPFDGSDLSSLASAVVQGHVRPAPSDGGVEPRLVQVLKRGLSPSPELRFPGMEEMLAELDVGRVRTTVDRRRRRPKAVVAAAAGLVALAAAIAVGIHFFPSAHGREPQAKTAAVVDPGPPAPTPTPAANQSTSLSSSEATPGASAEQASSVPGSSAPAPTRSAPSAASSAHYAAPKTAPASSHVNPFDLWR